MNDLLQETCALLSGVRTDWAICGGFAIDLFLQRNTRVHSDIDIAVSEDGREVIAAHMLRNGWKVFEYRGQGVVRPIAEPNESEYGRNLMCIRENCELVRFYPQPDGRLLHEVLHTGITRLNFIDVLFYDSDGADMQMNRNRAVRREKAAAILRSAGIPYLCPEFALLYKASGAQEEKNQADFERVYPFMDKEQRAWFHEQLRVLYPDGHIWDSAEQEFGCNCAAEIPQ